LSDYQKTQKVMEELDALQASQPAIVQTPTEAPISPDVEKALGLPPEPVAAPTPEKAGYIDTSKMAPKKEGYAPDSDNKKFFDFVQDRYRSGSLGVAPGYNFYSDSPLYNDNLVQQYKERFPELASEYAGNPDAGKYTPTGGPKTENKHELADFWDYAAGRQENNDLRDLYMYGFKSDDPRATPEILQRLKDENPWLWDEYQKKQASGTAEAVPGKDVPTTAEVEKPVGANGKGNKAETQEKKLPDIIGTLGKLGYSALEILQAGLAGGAGETDLGNTAYGKRMAKEEKAKDDEAKKAETADERAFQEKLFGLQDAAENRRLMSDQEFQTASQEKGWSQEEKMAVAQQARDLEKMGYDRATALMLASQGVGVTGKGTDPLGLKGSETLDALFADGKITKESYDQAVKDKAAQADAEKFAKGKAAYTDILGSPKAAGSPVPTQPTGTPQMMPLPTPSPTAAPLSIDEALAKFKTPAQKQSFLMQAGFKEMPNSGGMWMGPVINGQPGKVVKI
jgi:hypothetical protein